jgi:serine acetyltransferase
VRHPVSAYFKSAGCKGGALDPVDETIDSTPDVLARRIDPQGPGSVGVRHAMATDLKCYAAARWPDRCVDRLGWSSYLFLALAARGFQVLAFHRVNRWVLQHCKGKATIPAYLLRSVCRIGRFLIVILAKAEISPDTEIGPHVYLSNTGNMIIGATRIGTHSVIQGGVTIGANNASLGREKPCIGDKVWIGANSVISGGISLGSGATLQEGTVLSRSVPPNCLVGGNPARIIEGNFDNSRLLAQPELPCTVRAKS